MTRAQDSTQDDPAGGRGAGPEIDPEIARLTYEEAREALVEVVHRLESGSTTLEESLSLWERGEALADFCQSWLEAARTRLTAAQARRAGEAASTGGTASTGDTAAAASPATAEKEEDPWHTR